MKPRPIADRIPATLRAHPDVGAVGLLVAVSIAIRLPFLFRPLHGDEQITFSNMVLGRSFGGIVFGPFDSNSHLLNSLIMKAVYLGVGESPALMRLPNLMFALVTIALLYVSGSRVLGRATAFAAALLFSLHPAVVLFSVWGRGYAGMMLFTLLSSVLLLRVMRSFSWWGLSSCSLTGFLAGAFHLFAVNALIAQAVLVVLVAALPETGDPETASLRPARVLRIALGPVVALVLLAAVSLPPMLAGAVGTTRYLFQTAFPVALVNFLGGMSYRTELDAFSLAVVVPAAIGFLSLAGNRNLRSFLGVLFFTPVVLYVLSFFAPVFTLHPRFFSYLLPFYWLLVAAGLRHAARVVRAGREQTGRVAMVIRAAVWMCTILIAATLIARIEVPRGRALIRAQRAVADFVDAHPDDRFLTNDTGFVRVRLRQEDNMDRIRPALGITAIVDDLAREPAGAVHFIYVPQRRLTESDLIHYRSEVTPEVKYQRDERLRGWLSRNATLELEVAPAVRIYALRPAAEM